MKRIVIWVKEDVKTKLIDEAHRTKKTQMEIITKLIETCCKSDAEFLSKKGKKCLDKY